MFLFHGQIFKAISTYCSIYCCNECQASDHSWFFFCNIKRLMITMMTFEHVITRCEKKNVFFAIFLLSRPHSSAKLQGVYINNLDWIFEAAIWGKNGPNILSNPTQAFSYVLLPLKYSCLTINYFDYIC